MTCHSSAVEIKKEIILFQTSLPYPPSVNTYYRRSGYHIYLSAKGLRFRNEVKHRCRGVQTLTGDDLVVSVDLHPPDRRKRDVDNVQKPLLDALEHARVFFDDAQVTKLITQRLGRQKPGTARVTISRIVTLWPEENNET